MKEITQKRKTEILKKYSLSELKNLFAKRLDDGLFASVGASETGVREQREMPPHLLVWRGFEILTDSAYCEF